MTFKILAIDDDPPSLELVMSALEQEGVDILGASRSGIVSSSDSLLFLGRKTNRRLIMAASLRVAFYDLPGILFQRSKVLMDDPPIESIPQLSRHLGY